MNKHKILIVEDDQPIINLIRRFITDKNLEIIHESTFADGLRAIEEHIPDLVLLDLNLPDGDGLDLLDEIKARQFPTEVIIITAYGNVGIAVKAMSHGAFDFLEKPFSSDRLILSVRNALEHSRLSNALSDIQDLGRSDFYGFIGRSPAMQVVYNMIENCAASRATVLIQGESGTGKEICADALHKLSNRSANNFIPINCAAIPDDLIESEIFGHVKGAFTGAVSDRNGAVSEANEGTLFLDEIGEMGLELQAKLLRFIQTGEFQKLGSNKIHSVDVRIICATNRDLLQEVKNNRFREDLYYRLNVIQINLPPLSERDEDVLLIATRFLDRYSKEEGKSFSGFDPDVAKFLYDYDWPGNVRELQNIIRNIVVLNKGDEVTMDMIPQEIRSLSSTNMTSQKKNYVMTDVMPDNKMEGDNIKPLRVVEMEAIQAAIKFCDGNIPKAAALLDVSPSTIYRKKPSIKD